MKPIFDNALLKSRDFYHARYGRSALVVAIERGAGETQPGRRAKWQLMMARRYIERHLPATQSAPALDRVLSIKEEAGFVRIRVQVVQPHWRQSTGNYIGAEFERNSVLATAQEAGLALTGLEAAVKPPQSARPHNLDNDSNCEPFWPAPRKACN